MTTAAQAVTALEVSAPDDNMDVLSDIGFDFGDGDLDLDLDTAPSVQDDEMSLNDAATDGGIDMQEPPADQDDFMADHGDLIEEDEYHEDHTAAVSQAMNDSTTFEADMLAPPDEDLIDYSDDEAQQVHMHSPTAPEAAEHTQATHDSETASVSVNDHDNNDQTEEVAQPVEPIEVTNDQAQSHEVTPGQVAEEPAVSPKNQQSDVGAEPVDIVEDHVYADDGGVPLPADEHSPYGDHAGLEQRQDLQQHAGSDSDSVRPRDHQIELRPVTVNYAGNELWLFKDHDLDESGDFLLEDLSVAKSSISDVFQACRLSLGDDVSGEHEIGFRFDNLHNLELYEDNTACVAVSLERLVDLYHTLQAQDGNEDPECFYVTLQFRPRFATLLADIAQYAEQGSGYSAFDAAVAAGETHFSNVFSGDSTEHEHVEWEEDEEDDGQEVSSPSSDHSAIQGATADERDEQHFEAQDEEEQIQGQNIAQGSSDYREGVSLEGMPKQTLEVQDETLQRSVDSGLSQNSAPQSDADQPEAPHDTEATEVPELYPAEYHDERTPDQIAHDKQEAEDFVDYSDDEDDQDPNSVPAHPSSPSSSTVQGDEPTVLQDSDLAQTVDESEHGHAAGAPLDENDDDATLLTQTQYEDDAEHYAFQDYAETNDQGDPFQDYQAAGNAGNADDAFDANNVYTNDTEQDSTEINLQGYDGEVGLGFYEQPLVDDQTGDHGEDTFEVEEETMHEDALLDLDNAPEWAIDADPDPSLPGEDAVLLHDETTVVGDNEDGVVEQAVAPVSPVADPSLALLNDHGPLSPQGHKRSIDEVGDGADDAPDSIGMISRSACKRRLDADFFLPDAKRPRV